MDVYRSFGEPDGPGIAWSLGQIDEEGFAARLCERWGMSPEDVRCHLGRSDLFVPFPSTLAFFRERHRPQAIVTVNPATFRRLASDLGIAESADVIVVSAEERSMDKGLLCERALARLGVDCTPGEALLIDDRPSNLSAWAHRGGIGYHHRGDDAFRIDVSRGIDSLVRT
jgi:FMN phosphatase YigB (HAD superfamily)